MPNIAIAPSTRYIGEIRDGAPEAISRLAQTIRQMKDEKAQGQFNSALINAVQSGKTPAEVQQNIIATLQQFPRIAAQSGLLGSIIKESIKTPEPLSKWEQEKQRQFDVTQGHKEEQLKSLDTHRTTMQDLKREKDKTLAGSKVIDRKIKIFQWGIEQAQKAGKTYTDLVGKRDKAIKDKKEMDMKTKEHETKLSKMEMEEAGMQVKQLILYQNDLDEQIKKLKKAKSWLRNDADINAEIKKVEEEKEKAYVAQLELQKDVIGKFVPEGKQDFGLRTDGTPKGTGWLGVLRDSKGNPATEYSIGVSFDGKEKLIPALVPTLTQSEINHLLQGKKATKAIVQKAVDHAKLMMSQGKPVWAPEEKAAEQPAEQPTWQTEAGKEAQPTTKTLTAAPSKNALVSSLVADEIKGKTTTPKQKELPKEITNKIVKETENIDTTGGLRQFASSRSSNILVAGLQDLWSTLKGIDVSSTDSPQDLYKYGRALEIMSWSGVEGAGTSLILKQIVKKLGIKKAAQVVPKLLSGRLPKLISGKQTITSPLTKEYVKMKVSRATAKAAPKAIGYTEKKLLEGRVPKMIESGGIKALAASTKIEYPFIKSQIPAGVLRADKGILKILADEHFWEAVAKGKW